MDPGVEVILPYYGAMFVLAIPLVRLASRTLAVHERGRWWWWRPWWSSPRSASTCRTGEPIAHVAGSTRSRWHAPLLVSGSYPAVEYMAFMCPGSRLGRLDLSSTEVAARLAAGGAALALATWLGSGMLLFELGGLAHLRDAAPSGLTAQQARNVILWDPTPPTRGGGWPNARRTP